MNGNNLAMSLDAIAFVLMSHSMAADYVPSTYFICDKKTRVTWTGSKPELFSRPLTTLADYRYCIQFRQYNVLLLDGSFFQITFDLNRQNELLGHRLLYWPCPFAECDLSIIDPNIDHREYLVQRCDEITAGFREPKLVAPWRLDYDPDAAKPGHSAVHLTVHHGGCRIPVSTPVDLRRFLTFVFDHLSETPFEISDYVPEKPSLTAPKPELSFYSPHELHITWKPTY